MRSCRFTCSSKAKFQVNVTKRVDSLGRNLWMRVRFPPPPPKKFMKVELTKLAHARSGDKGDTANVGVIALKDEFYPLLVREVTAEKVKEHFGEMVKGEVERFELPNLGALNFLLHESLGGGGTLSLMTDAQGKTFSTALLRMNIEIDDKEANNFGLT